MNLELRGRHAVITDDDKDHPWVATVDRQKYPGLAEVLFKAAEEYCAASANRRADESTQL